MYYALSPSILAANFGDLGNQIRSIDAAGAELIHIDVMDGKFVPSISFGMPVIASIRNITERLFDVHMMVSEPDRYVKDMVDSGADIITVHAEACTHLDRTIQHIKSYGLKAGVALNPATSLNCLEYILEDVDMVLLMTVNPGFGGQKFIPQITEKIRTLRKIINEKELSIDIEVDGGINKNTIDLVLNAGANIIVAGSSVFSGEVDVNTKALLDIIHAKR